MQTYVQRRAWQWHTTPNLLQQVSNIQSRPSQYLSDSDPRHWRKTHQPWLFVDYFVTYSDQHLVDKFGVFHVSRARTSVVWHSYRYCPLKRAIHELLSESYIGFIFSVFLANSRYVCSFQQSPLPLFALVDVPILGSFSCSTLSETSAVVVRPLGGLRDRNFSHMDLEACEFIWGTLSDVDMIEALNGPVTLHTSCK